MEEMFFTLFVSYLVSEKMDSMFEKNKDSFPLLIMSIISEAWLLFVILFYFYTLIV